ncbi:Lrp/AsnC family transcriptional regulator [Promicromonospora sp. NPDC057138]|uniref:Lrp/AsnC family transcriptional regulator n=1 Tax=Promicromonospora sp. NPDC057138 TaxID=3346031 RepID=UPI00363B4190
MLNIDRLDAELLSALARDARVGIVELAKTLGVSRNTVQARMSRLEKAGIFEGFVPRIDLTDIGVEVEAFVTLTLQQAQFDSIVDRLEAMPNVLEIHVTTGGGDLLVRLSASTLAELQDLLHAIVELPGVAQSDTTVCLTTPVRYRVQPLLEKVTKDASWGRAAPARRVDEQGSRRSPG